MNPSLITLILYLVLASSSASEDPWPLHIIDDIPSGADGVRLADVNRDGLPDITTGWEEGGLTRVYINPGHQHVRDKWPAVTSGRTPSAEDAVFADIDGDGAVDVITSCEGKTRTVFVNWAPKLQDYLTAKKWTTTALPATQDQTGWMFALPLQIDGQHGIDIVVSARGRSALVGWLESPPNPRVGSDWKLHPLYDAGWIMSLIAEDVDNDGDEDLIVSDRKGNKSGVLWLENPGTQKATAIWAEHRIGASGREVMFLDLADLDGDREQDIVAAVRRDAIHWFRRPENPKKPWSEHIIPVAIVNGGLGSSKGVRVGDIDGNGTPDIVLSCEHAEPPKRGIVWLSYGKSLQDPEWSVHDISGPEGIKYDRIELVDLDGDGDLDVITCEEKHRGRGLGVFWHENPTR